jgi:hypothetical protein
MFNNPICALCGENELVYVLYEYHGHVFRKYPNGRLEKADEWEQQNFGK